MEHPPRTYARIDRRILRQNYEEIRRAVGPRVAITAVVKANAYGHGAVEVTRTLFEAGARHFAVACLEEGIELREAGVEGEILVLSGLEESRARPTQTHRLTPVIHDARELRCWEAQAVATEQELPYHLEINSGMNRLGLDVPSPEALMSLIAEGPHLRLEGLSSHLASAEDFGNGCAVDQQQRFMAIANTAAEHGIRPRYLHLANSAAIAYRPTMDCDMVRPGLALYGYLSPPSGANCEPRIRVKPALEWKTRVLSVRDVAAGARLGYSGTYRADQPMRVGVLSVGYGDGLDRRMSNGGEVLVGGVRCPIVGLVSMDTTLVDVSAAPETPPGAEVTLIGPTLDADQMAGRCGTIPYEILCGISRRVVRLYH